MPNMRRKTGSEYELTGLRDESPSARLLDAQPPKLKRAPPLNKPNCRHRDFLKHIGLQLPDTLAGRVLEWRSQEEHPKVAAYKSRGMAALNSLLHLLPMGGAVVLLFLFWSKYWTDSPSDNATALQFVAKFHELLMQASLISILLHIIRAQALDGYMPLGALSGAAQGPQLSYLWSLDFLSAIMAKRFSLQSRIVFAVSISVLVSMTAIVGPSSAVLMIPRPAMPYDTFKEMHYTNVSENEIFPSRLDYTSGLNFSLASEMKNAQIVGSSMKEKGPSYESYTWPGVEEFTRTMKISYDEARLDSVKAVQGGATVATTLSISQLWYGISNLPEVEISRKMRPDTLTNSTFSISALQPMARATCTSFLPGHKEEFHYVLHNGTSRPLAQITNLGDSMSKLNESFANDTDWLPPLWLLSPDDPALLIAVIALYDRTVDADLQFYAICTVTSFWRRAITWVTITTKGRVETDFPANNDFWERENLRPITIPMENIVGFDTEQYSLGNDTMLATSLAIGFVAAIAEMPGKTRNLPEQIDEIPMDLVHGYNRSQAIEEFSVLLYELIMTIYGYGYGATDISTRLSVAVFTAYCIIALTYVVYIISTGHTSIAWDSATELIMLALQSKEPKDLGHISVGLDSMETFRRGVGIRVSTVEDDETGEKKERLELVFEDDEEAEKRGLTKVVRNKAY